MNTCGDCTDNDCPNQGSKEEAHEICFITEAKATESPAPEGQAEFDLLSARDKALSAMSELAEELRKLGVYHYEEMVRGQQQAIRGAIITVNNALERSA